MFYGFLKSDPEPDNLIGSGSGKKVRIRAGGEVRNTGLRVHSLPVHCIIVVHLTILTVSHIVRVSLETNEERLEAAPVNEMVVTSIEEADIEQINQPEENRYAE